MSDNTLADIIRGPVQTIEAGCSIADALALMGERRISCLLVTRDGQPCGIVTEKDVVRCYAGVASHAQQQVGEIMTPAPLTAPASIGHLEAYRLMVERNIRHLPVTDSSGRIVGLVTESDYIRTLGTDYYIRLKDVASVMAPVAAVSGKAPLAQALDLLGRADVSCVVVTGDGGARGILTERDIVRLLGQGIDPKTTPVATVMTSPVVTVPRDSNLLDASKVLAERRIRRVIVVDPEGHPVGILSQHEMVKGLEHEYIGHLEGVIAEKNKVLEELNEARRSLEDKSKLLQRTLDELSVAHAELRDFTKIAAHDLQEPLRRIMTYSQLLERESGEALAEPARGYLGVVVEGAGRARQLVQDLVGYSAALERVERLETVDAGEAAQGAVALLGREIAASGAEVTIGALPKVQATRAVLVEIFSCLLNNAIKFRRVEVAPRLAIEAVEQPGCWRFTVSDNGIGIEPAYLGQIFELFERLHPGGTYPGTGVGLAICRRLVELLGGSIWAESTPGQGSRFHFTLARAEG
jgi:signal transduction histidine kinase